MAKQANEFLTSYYYVFYYCKSFTGVLLNLEEYTKQQSRHEIVKTHSFIIRKIESYFDDIPTFWLINRH